MSKGVYSLFVKLGDGKLVRLRSNLSYYLMEGYYIYTGSALGEGSASLEGRVERHLRLSKRRFWHIDRLLDGDGVVLNVVYAPTESRMECEVNKMATLLLGARPIEGFGSSDCRAGCLGHLLYLKDAIDEGVVDILYEAYFRVGLEPRDLGMRFGCR